MDKNTELQDKLRVLLAITRECLELKKKQMCLKMFCMVIFGMTLMNLKDI